MLELFQKNIKVPPLTNSLMVLIIGPKILRINHKRLDIVKLKSDLIGNQETIDVLHVVGEINSTIDDLLFGHIFLLMRCVSMFCIIRFFYSVSTTKTPSLKYTVKNYF